MKPILVAYATTDGHARKVAQHLASAFSGQGHSVDLVDVATPAVASVAPIYAAAILIGSLHVRVHQAALVDFAKHNHDWLNAIPSAFLSVSLTAVLDDAQSRRECMAAAEGFTASTAFRPGIVLPVAGALPYTQYDWFRRFAMKMIARQHGGDTDTTRDFEYTDWAALTRFAQEFVAVTNLERGH